MNRNSSKIRWTTTAIIFGWVLLIIPPAEDLPNEPPKTSPTMWWIWVAVNIVALVFVHLWISEEARIDRLIAKRRRASMRRHPVNG